MLLKMVPKPKEPPTPPTPKPTDHQVPMPGRVALGALAGIAVRATFPYVAGLLVFGIGIWALVAFISNLEDPEYED